MTNPYHLERFIEAQEKSYAVALAEIKKGKKQSHWMWYIFPQVQGLGFSQTSRYYAIQNSSEAAAFLQHPVLGSRLIEISKALLALGVNDAHKIFGSPDDMKLQSCMTLFASLPNADAVFQTVLDQFFKGKSDAATLEILKRTG